LAAALFTLGIYTSVGLLATASGIFRCESK